MLAHHFGVSYRAALYRLKSLRHISHPESLKLLEQEEFGREYLKAFDMFDDVGDPEHRRYWDGTVKLSRIRPFCGRILLDQRLRINDLAVAASGENAAKLLNLTVPCEVRGASILLIEGSESGGGCPAAL